MFDKIRSFLSSSDEDSSDLRGTKTNTGVNVVDGDPTGLLGTDPTGLLDNDEWFEAIGVSPVTESEPSATSSPSSTPQVKPGTASPPTTSPISTEFPRGTFVLPRSRPFLQNLETRAQNGAHEVVETVYVLAGPTYTTPNVMFQLDDPELYDEATESSVTSFTQSMARQVARAYEGRQPPKLLARIHTHPNGTTTPSSTDKSGTDETLRIYEEELGTDDFEFFQGIHAFDHTAPKSTDLDNRYVPQTGLSGLSWHGSRFQHTLALYDAHFKRTRPVEVLEE